MDSEFALRVGVFLLAVEVVLCVVFCVVSVVDLVKVLQKRRAHNPNGSISSVVRSLVVGLCLLAAFSSWLYLLVTNVIRQ